MILAFAGCFYCASCSNDDWDYDHSLEHVYFFGPQEWGYDDTKKGNANRVLYDLSEGETATIPMQFWCEFKRSYDVETFYYSRPLEQGEKFYPTRSASKTEDYAGATLVRGVDYDIVDANGNALTPNADGAFSLQWPNALKGVQNIYVKIRNGAQKGRFYISTFNPNSDVTLSNQDVSSTIQNKTDNYEVRIFTQNYLVMINVQ